MAGPARELSTKWWNVIRREMYATRATEHEVACPDCGSSTHLMKGRFGRFYKCCRLDCRGTLGAKLDGTPRDQKGPPELLDARRRARDAVHAVVLERDRCLTYEVEVKKKLGVWWSCSHRLASCKDEFRVIVFGASLDPVTVAGKRTPSDLGELRAYWHPCGLFLRRRNIAECERVIEAATIVLERVRSDFRRLRNNAWDKVLLDEVLVSPDEVALQAPAEVELCDT